MADLKPLGSEKLNGDEKLKRILELTYYNQKNKSSSSVKTELVKESKTGGVYGIVKEKDGYYVKRGLNESSLDYIGGMFMKNKNKFSSYSDAFKRLDFIKGQEELQEATKYVLKQNKPQEEGPKLEPSMDLPPVPQSDVSGDVAPSSDVTPTDDIPEPTDMGGEDIASDDEKSKRSSYMAEAQKFAGKLGQELRDLQDQMESDDIKYILNMIISAVSLDKLDDEDIEEIGKKFEREEEMGDEDSESEEDIPAEEPEIEPEAEVNEYDSMDALESFINTPIEADEINLSNYSDLGKVDEMDELKELDLDEIKNDINQAISEKLSKYFN